jgi:membrane dipeptidase
MPRNMTDDMLRALARNGGVISINFYPGFISRRDAEAARRNIGRQASQEPDLAGAALDAYARKAYSEEFKLKPALATIDDVVDQIDHAVKVAGIDHVGIGSDFDGMEKVPHGLEDTSKMPKLAAALKKKGYSDADIQKIWSGNVLRVIRAVVGK